MEGITGRRNNRRRNRRNHRKVEQQKEEQRKESHEIGTTEGGTTEGVTGIWNNRRRNNRSLRNLEQQKEEQQESQEEGTTEGGTTECVTGRRNNGRSHWKEEQRKESREFGTTERGATEGVSGRRRTKKTTRRRKTEIHLIEMEKCFKLCGVSESVHVRVGEESSDCSNKMVGGVSKFVINKEDERNSKYSNKMVGGGDERGEGVNYFAKTDRMITFDEAADILVQNIGIVYKFPNQPDAGYIYLYDDGQNKLKKEDWRSDGYTWKNNGNFKKKSPCVVSGVPLMEIEYGPLP